MEKKVIFIEEKDYSGVISKGFFLDGVIYSEAEERSGKGFFRQYGDVRSGQGEFFSIIVNDLGQAEVSSDFCGFYSLYWKKHEFHGKPGVLISNCFHSLSRYSKSAFDASKIIANLASKNQIFVQDYNNHTCLEDIKRLGWNEVITVGEKGLAVKKKGIGLAFSYEELVEKGISKAQSTLLREDRKGILNLYLSGGKDSRAILALLFSLGISPNCTTQDPSKYKGSSKSIIDQDFLIANFLVKNYGLKWFLTGRKRAEKLSFEESIEHHVFFRDGYYLFSPSQHLVYSCDWGDEVQLRGGGGGLFKSTWGEYIRGSYVNEKLTGGVETLESDAGILFDQLNHSKGVPEEAYESGKKMFVASLKDLSADTVVPNIYNVLDTHYISYRNRSHFGHIRSSWSQGKKVFYPLVNEFFYEASMLLSEEERTKGKLVFDIIEKTFPELNDYPYDDGYHELIKIKSRYKEVAEESSSMEDFYHAQRLNKKSEKGVFSGAPYDVAYEEHKFIEQSSDEVFSSLGGGFDNKKFAKYFSSLKEDKKQRGKLCSLFASSPIAATSSFSKCHEFIYFNS